MEAVALPRPGRECVSFGMWRSLALPGQCLDVFSDLLKSGLRGGGQFFISGERLQIVLCLLSPVEAGRK